MSSSCISAMYLTDCSSDRRREHSLSALSATVWTGRTSSSSARLRLVSERRSKLICSVSSLLACGLRLSFSGDSKDVRLVRQLSSNAKPIFYPRTCLSPPTPTYRGRTQLLMVSCRPHCILHSGMCSGDSFYC